jgi:hypothetical protein
MKQLIPIILIIFAYNISRAENKITIEAANCFGNEHLPLSSGWHYKVNNKGLQFKEFAAKGSYKIHKLIRLSLATGWIIDREQDPDIYPDVIGWEAGKLNVRKIFYALPTIGLWTEAVRFNIGALLYNIDHDKGRNDNYYNSLEGDHHIMPSASLEIGYPWFVYGRLLNSFPLSTGGFLEFGLGGYVWGQNEQKIYFIGVPTGIGYRGEFKIYRDYALSFGILGADFTTDGIVILNFGIKRNF